MASFNHGKAELSGTTGSGTETQADKHISMQEIAADGVGAMLSNGFDPRRNLDPSPFAKDKVLTNADMTLSKTHIPKKDPSIDSASDDGQKEGLDYSLKPTGLCYDARMRFHTTPDPTDPHPERPDRITSIFKQLMEGGLIKSERAVQTFPAEFLQRIPAYSAKMKEICLVHTEDHYNFVKATSMMDTDALEHYTAIGDSVYFHQCTYLSAKLSVGGAVNCCRYVVEGKAKNAIAVIRPPGHHAEETEPQGFCLFNNVAIAARVCQNEFGSKCRKILILDWDVHHGNGIQHAFYDDPNVLYVSLHRWTRSPGGSHFYPGESGAPNLCGSGAGFGRNVNIPFSEKHMHDADYIFAFQEVVMPIAYEFNPDLVIVSAGFDAADGDELGSYHVTPPGYAQMTHMLSSLADGKLVICLEVIQTIVYICDDLLKADREVLMGEPPQRLELGEVSHSARRDIESVKRLQSRFWNCMTEAAEVDRDWLEEVEAERLHDVFREYQSAKLYSQYRLVKLPVFRDIISKTFDNQVFATRDYHQCTNLLVIFHDPPEITGTPDAVTKKIDPHNTWMVDVVKFYIKRAIDAGYGVMDVNVPKHYSNLMDRELRLASMRTPESLNEELAIYLWENYIEANEGANIIAIGIGDAYQALCHLLKQRSEDCVERIKAIVGFVADNKLLSVTSDTDASLSSWYHKSSRVYVASDHPAFDSDRKPPKRKFGALVRSPDISLSRMLARHQIEVFEWIAKRISNLPPSVPVSVEPEVRASESSVELTTVRGTLSNLDVPVIHSGLMGMEVDA